MNCYRKFAAMFSLDFRLKSRIGSTFLVADNKNIVRSKTTLSTTHTISSTVPQEEAVIASIRVPEIH